MIRESVVNTRGTALQAISSAAGPVVVHAESLTIESSRRIELIDLTDRLAAVVSRVAVREGMLNVWSLHTTCALLINEFQPALVADMQRFLEEVVAGEAPWLHNDPRHSDCDRSNAGAHLRAMLLGHGLTLQVSGGELVLGQWQRALAAELDGPRTRTFRLQVIGIQG